MKFLNFDKITLRALWIHFLLNLVIAGIVLILVLWVWYPYPYYKMLGGLELVGILLAIDLICGPLLTLFLINGKKSKKSIIADMSLILFIQCSALGYGLYTISLARPIALTFEIDRFVVISSADIQPQYWQNASPEIKNIPLFQIREIGLREPKDSQEKDLVLDLSLQGIERSNNPEWWLNDAKKMTEDASKKKKPLSELIQYYQNDVVLQQWLQKHQPNVKELYYLPFTSALNKEWTAIVNQQGEIVDYLPLDAFMVQ